MTGALTAAEVALLRTHPHKAKLYMAIWRPSTALACQVNDTGIARGEREITYDNVTSGEYGAVIAGQTMLIGTTAGARDVGKVRVKSATDTVITVAQNDDIDWQDGLYLTIQNNYELWSKKPRITESGGTLTRYIDYDTAYNYQTSRQNPVPITGPPACAFIDDDTGLATVDFVGEDSYSVAPGKTIGAYSWVFPSGTPSVSSDAGTAAAPVEVTWDTAGGHTPYLVSLEVTDVAPNQTAGTGRRPAFIFERTGANAPYSNFEISDLSGDFSQGGWEAKFKVFGSVAASDFPDGAMVVVFAEEWYGNTKQSIGGYPGRENIKFVGYITDEATRVDPGPGNAAGYVTFEASTINGLLKNRDGYTTTLEYDSTPGSWNEVKGLDVDMGAYYVAQWFSTLLTIADVTLSGDTRAIKNQDFPKADLYRQIDDLCSTAIRARLVSDKQGCLHLEINPQFRSSTDRDGIATVISLTSQDWRDVLSLPRQQEADTSYVECQGKYFNGSAETPFIAEAPGPASQQEGIEQPYTGFVFGSQTDANNMAGYVLADANNEYPDVPLSLAGNYSFCDIVQEWYKLTVASTENKRGIAWDEARFLCRRVELKYDAENGTLFTSVNLEKEATGLAGQTGTFPAEPPEEEPEDPEPPAYPPLPPDPEETPGYLAWFDKTNGFYWKAPDIDWEARNTGLSDTAFTCGMIERGWQTLQGTSDPESVILFGGGMGWLAKSLDAGKTWTDITPVDAPATIFYDLACPNDATGTLYALVGNAEATEIHLGKSLDLGVTWTWTQVYAVEEGGSEPVTGWLYPESTNAWHGAATASIWHTDPPYPCGPGSAVYAEKMAVSNAGAGIDDDGSMITWTLYQYPCNLLFNSAYLARAGFVADFGQVVTNVTKIEIESGMVSGTAGRTAPGYPRVYYSELYNSSIEVQAPYGYPNNSTPTGWTLLNYFNWIAFDDAFGVREVYNDPGTPLDLQYLFMNGEFEDALSPTYPNAWVCGVDHVRVYGTFTPSGGTCTPWGIAVDFEDGSNVYVTYKWSGGGTSIGYLDTYDSDLNLANSTSLNSYGASVAYPRVVWQPDVANFGDIVYVFGAGSSGGLMLESLDAGVTITDRSGDLSAVTAVVALAAKGDGAGQVTAFQAFTDTPDIYAEMAWTWSLVGSVPFTLHRNALSIAYDAALTAAVGNSAAGAAMAETSPSPYSTYTDITGGLPVDGGCVRLEWITP